MRKFLCFLILTLLAVAWAAGLSCAEETNLLMNPGFEEISSDGLPAGWNTWSWFTDSSFSRLCTEKNTAHGGERCASIQNFTDNDAFFLQTVEVEPEELYRFSGWILADGITPLNRWGANLSVEGLYVSTQPVYDTDGMWHYVELYGETGPDQTEVTVCVRVGGYSGECTGKALFDDLSLVKVDEIPGEAVASLWFDPADWSIWEPDETEEDVTGDVTLPSSWKHLLAPFALVYLTLGMMMLRALIGRGNPVELSKKKNAPWWLFAGFVAALAVRLCVGYQIEGYPVDIGCFRAWGEHMLSAGPSGFPAC